MASFRPHLPRTLTLLTLAVALAAASFAILACRSADVSPPPATAAERPAAAAAAAPRVAGNLCTGQGESYGIQDFPCSSTTVQGWVSQNNRDNADGPRTRMHAWYLFAGLNRDVSPGVPLWRKWPTSTQAFPGQFGAGAQTGAGPTDLDSLPGAILERPAPGTPRSPGVDVDPGVDAKNLALPGAPKYAVPQQVAGAYPSCVAAIGGAPALIDGPTLQNNGDVMVAGVIYSPNASNAILSQKFWSATYLDGLLPASGFQLAPKNITMPDQSVVLKVMLWPVRYDGFTPLPQWDNLDPDADRIIVNKDGKSVQCEVYAGFENKDLWKRAVALTAAPGTPPAKVDATYLGSVPLGDAFDLTCEATRYRNVEITYRQAPTVSLDRFYTLRFTAQQLASMAPCDRALLDQSAYWSYNRAFSDKDALVLVAMHMMTKEQPDWTFQSAWWFDGAKSCPSGDTQCERFAKHRPGDVTGSDRWQNYLMTTTYGITQIPQATQPNRWPRDLQANDWWPVAYNPYIELAATHPIETNCMNCHHRAAWPSRLNPNRRFPDRSSAYLVLGTKVPGLLQSFKMDNLELFHGLATVDSMWAISDRAYYTTAPETAAAH